jgi:hypothetical protein
MKKTEIPKRIFVVMSFNPEALSIYSLIREAVFRASELVKENLDVVRADTMEMHSATLTDHIYSGIKDADLIIADISENRPNVMYELGYAHALSKPVILIGTELSEQRPFNLSGVYILLYGPRRTKMSFVNALAERIVEAVEHPNQVSAHHAHPADRHHEDLPTVFISYSHIDRSFLGRLQVHLRPLVKESRIDLWDDTRIKAGEKWKQEIEKALNRSAIAILLISADFLASDFIVDNELPPLLRAAEEKGTTILPVIVKPCRFLRDKNLSVFQAINDPREPLIKLGEADQEELYAHIAERVENEIHVR